MGEAEARRSTIAVLVGIALSTLVASCAFQGGDVDLSDRCAGVMQRAFPGGDIAITRDRAADDTVPNYDTVIARVRGVRSDIPPHAGVARQVAAQCRFDNGILTEFRWTKGPVQKAAAARS